MDLLPGLTFIVGSEKLSAASSKVESGRIVGVGGQAIAQYGFVCLLLRQAAHERFPGRASIASPINPQPSIASATEFLRLDRNNISAIGIMRVHDDRKSKIRRHAVGNVGPVLRVIVGAVNSPVILQEKPFRPRGMHGDLMHALPELGILVGHEQGSYTTVVRHPRRACIVGAVDPAG